MFSHADKMFFKEVGLVQHTPQEEAMIDAQRTKHGIGYHTSDFKPYTQPSTIKDRSELQRTLEREVTTDHAYAGTIPKGNKQIPCYWTYWEKRKPIKKHSGAARTAEDVVHSREYETESLFLALEDDGRIDSDVLSRMSLEQLRKAYRAVAL